MNEWNMLRREMMLLRTNKKMFLIWLVGLVAAAEGLKSAADEVSFNRDVRPLLAKHCLACHGPDREAREGDLRLDQRAAAIDAGAFVPGQPEKSDLVERIESHDPKSIMPPPEAKHPLTAAQIELLRRWIAAGAQYDTHWSFVPPKKAELPKSKGHPWPRGPIDHFVLRRLAEQGMTPSVPADRATWLRRVSLDLTGLPPTLTEADAFLADESADAFEKVVERLLESTAFGEHWARMWLDLARYADTKGYEKDRHRDIWRYRDWVIEALNRDMPFDQFTIEQLAGDLLPNATSDQILATAFHRNTMTNEEGGTDNEEFRVAAVKDRVDTTIQVWMGLTMGCAKCHSHKYDPITLRDYYAFYAIFNQTQDADNESPFWQTPTKEQSLQLTKLAEQIQQVERDGAAKADRKGELAALRKKLEDLRRSVPKTPVMLELNRDRRRVTKMHNRGNFLDQGEPVDASVLTSFGELPQGAEADRLGTARWLMQPENPLTARVMVNRVWARLFGVGLVETEEDFGTQGLPPRHAELLDWLAVDFREQGWSLQQLLRSIVLSATYRQSSHSSPEQLQVDPRNDWLGRGPRFRLTAEQVRDQALAVSGLLTRKVGGPSVMPPQPGGIWKSTYNGQDWKNAVGPDRYRRGLYTYLKRTSPYPSLTTFDAGSGEVCQVRRVRTNTPLQALVTLNDEAYMEAAGALAQHMQKAGPSLEARLVHGFRRVLVRRPEPRELQRLVQLYRDLEEELEAPETLLKSAGQKSGDARLVAIANVLLNLDETLMKP